MKRTILESRVWSLETKIDTYSPICGLSHWLPSFAPRSASSFKLRLKANSELRLPSELLHLLLHQSISLKVLAEQALSSMLAPLRILHTFSGVELTPSLETTATYPMMIIEASSRQYSCPSRHQLTPPLRKRFIRHGTDAISYFPSILRSVISCAERTELPSDSCSNAVLFAGTVLHVSALCLFSPFNTTSGVPRAHHNQTRPAMIAHTRGGRYTDAQDRLR